MMQQNENKNRPISKQHPSVLAVVDVGSAKTIALVGEITENGLRYRGHGMSESRGSRKGAIVDLEKAGASIQRAVEEAERVAQTAVEHVVVGVGGIHIKGVNSRGGIALGVRPREITREDIRQAVDKARSVALPPDRTVLHLLPQEFIIDQQGSIRDPAGMTGTRLEVNLHMVTGTSTVTQNVVTVINRAGIHVDDAVFEALACADCTLKADERELGVCLADIGAGSTDIVVFFEGAVAHSGVVPIGGDHFTNDVAVGLRTPLAEAEKIKRVFGSAIIDRVPAGNEIEVPAVGDRPSRLMSQRLLAEILEPRAIELFELVRENLRQGGVLDSIGAGIVLTGGGARLPGLAEIAEQELERPARLAFPMPVARLPVELAEPEYATVIGLLLYAERGRQSRNVKERGLGSRLKSLFGGSP